MTRNVIFGVAAILYLPLLGACSDSAPDLIELTYRDRCPATDAAVSLLTMDDLARLSGAKLLNPETSSAPLLIRVNAPAGLASGQGIRLGNTAREGSMAIATFIAYEANRSNGNACSVLTISPDAVGYESVSAIYDGEEIGKISLSATLP